LLIDSGDDAVDVVVGMRVAISAREAIGCAAVLDGLIPVLEDANGKRRQPVFAFHEVPPSTRRGTSPRTTKTAGARSRDRCGGPGGPSARGKARPDGSGAWDRLLD